MASKASYLDASLDDSGQALVRDSDQPDEERRGSTRHVVITSRSCDEADRHIDIMEDPHAPVGGIVWISALCLGEMLAKRQMVVGRHVLELGSGTGYVGIIAAALGSHVIMTDRSPLMQTIQENILRNRVQDFAQAVTLEWGSEFATDHNVDTVIMAECIYGNKQFWPLLVQTLKSLAPTEIWLANPGGRMDHIFLKMADLWVWEELMPPPGNAHVFDVRVYWGRLSSSLADLKPRSDSASRDTHWSACDGCGPSPPTNLFKARQEIVVPLAIEDGPPPAGSQVD